jgi:hypothetical protein
VDEDCDGVDSEVQLPDDLDRDGSVDEEAGGDDCDDTDAGIFPGAVEACGTGVDNNCDGAPTDCGEDDTDADGFSGAEDCGPADANIYPGAPDACGDLVDQDCTGGDQACEGDTDGDGFVGDDDCDNGSADVRPGATEFCDRIDNNCDGLIDNGNPLAVSDDAQAEPERCGTFEEVGVCQLGFTVCSESAGQAIHVCAYAVSPSAELCDGLDNDCNNQTDEGNPGRRRLHRAR